jgi:hypothetical protein
MMKRYMVPLLAAVLFTATGASRLQSQGCYPVGQSAHNHLTYYRGLASAGDSVSRRILKRFQLVPAQASEVFVLSDSIPCKAAAVAYATERGDTSSVRPVYALRVGPRRTIVWDPRERDASGEALGVVFDEYYRVLALVTGF